MSKPSEFPTVQLEDVVEVLDHLRIPVNSAERLDRTGTVPYYGANGLQGWIDRPLFDEPLILLAEDGGNFEEFANRPIAYRIEGPSWVNNHAHIIRSKAGVCQSYIFWSLVNKDIRRFIAGGTRTKLTQGELRRIEIRLPGAKEQQAIAQILDTLDTAIRKTEALIDKLKAVKQGLLHDLLTRGIDANGELRPPQSEAPQLYKESPLGWVPREWTQGKLSEVLEIGLGFAFRSEDYTENGILSFRVTNIGRPLEDFGGSIFLPDSFWDKYKSQQLTGGEIVIVMVGATTGKLGLVPVDVCPALQNQNMWNLIPAPGVEREFLWMLLPSAVQRHLSLAQGSARDFLTQKDFLETEIAFPNANEQRRIISAGEALEQRIVSEQQYLKKLSAQKVGLMDDLLTGRVRVTPLLEASS